MDFSEMKTYIAIIGLTVLESIALVTGHDGLLFSLIVAAVSGLGGYAIHDKKEEIKEFLGIFQEKKD